MSSAMRSARDPYCPPGRGGRRTMTTMPSQPRTRSQLLALTVILAPLALPAAVNAAAGPTPPLSHAGRWITDAEGRVVILHGVNEVYKVDSYAPKDIGFGGDDAKF